MYNNLNFFLITYIALLVSRVNALSQQEKKFMNNQFWRIDKLYTTSVSHKRLKTAHNKTSVIIMASFKLCYKQLRILTGVRTPFGSRTSSEECLMLTTFARVALPETCWHQICATQCFQTKSIITQFARAVTLEWEVKINFVSPFPFSFEINDLRFEDSRESTMILISHGHWCLAEIIFLFSQTTGYKTLDSYQEWSPLPLCFQFFLWLGYLTNHSELGRFSQNFYFSDVDRIFVLPKCSLFSYL